TTTRIQTARWLILLFIKAFLDYPAAAISIASRFGQSLGRKKQLGSTIYHCALIQEKLAQFVSIKRTIAGRVQVQKDPATWTQVLFCVLQKVVPLGDSPRDRL